MRVGCEIAECAAAVCAASPFCCETAWDAGCADLARLHERLLERGPSHLSKSFKLKPYIAETVYLGYCFQTHGMNHDAS